MARRKLEMLNAAERLEDPRVPPAMNRLKPIHPGEILDKEFLEPMEVSQYRLATDIGVPPRRINEIVHTDN